MVECPDLLYEWFVTIKNFFSLAADVPNKHGLSQIFSQRKMHFYLCGDILPPPRL
jgi:hypothetical protein